jgi:hypothetical protein
MSDGPVASVRVQAVVSRTRDNEAIASQLEARRAMAVPSGGTNLDRGNRNVVRRFLTI